MSLLHIWTQELLSTGSADSFKPTFMNLAHMASVAIFLDHT